MRHPSSPLRRALRASRSALLWLTLTGFAGDARGFDFLAKPQKHPPLRTAADVGSLGLKEGDIIFHTSKSSQSEAIRIATNSRFNHTAILLIYNGKLSVLEAVQPVRITPLAAFIARGQGHFVVKRLRDREAVLTPSVIARMKDLGRGLIGRPYDLYFRWDDERIYCSELVWKLYKQAAGVEVAKVQKASDLNLNHRVVRELIEKRYGRGAAVPQDEPIVSPQAIYESERLVTVHEQ
jgi:hypothetical protein